LPRRAAANKTRAPPGIGDDLYVYSVVADLIAQAKAQLFVSFFLFFSKAFYTFLGL
jgi:hypothetical protein